MQLSAEWVLDASIRAANEALKGTGSLRCSCSLTISKIHIVSGVRGLRDVSIKIPLAVAPGSTVTMFCQYDLEKDPLYTVKWYKGREEFFRFVPKELPHTKVFVLPGVNVDVSTHHHHHYHYHPENPVNLSLFNSLRLLDKVNRTNLLRT